MSRAFLLAATASGFLSVALGAFAAHGLKNTLDSYALGVFHTGVQYQFFHALALLALALWLKQSDTGLLKTAGYCFIVGTVLFSGSLYILALSGVKLWGAVTPFGGIAFLIGWGCLFAAAW
jgi:uncharacterized membrane protein YgdD (TMEM256/DUF423 family)